jgi:hypothetical protein
MATDIAPVEAPAGLSKEEEKAWREHNAVAWLKLTAVELVERSGSLGGPPQLVPHPIPDSGFAEGAPLTKRVKGKTVTEKVMIPVGPNSQQATWDDVDTLRENADAHAVALAGKAFCDKWIGENRPFSDGRHLVGGLM